MSLAIDMYFKILDEESFPALIVWLNSVRVQYPFEFTPALVDAVDMLRDLERRKMWVLNLTITFNLV